MQSEDVAALRPIVSGSNLPVSSGSIVVHRLGRLDTRFASLDKEVKEMMDREFHKESCQITVIDMTSFKARQRPRLPIPAPPPKLHHATFWRSITRRIEGCMQGINTTSSRLHTMRLNSKEAHDGLAGNKTSP